MELIEGLVFESPVELVTRVRSQLKSFDAAGQIDEGDFYDWIAYVLSYLNISGWNPQAAVIDIKNQKGPLPANFAYLHAGYELESSSGYAPKGYLGGNIITVDKITFGDCTEPLPPCEEVEEDCEVQVKYYINAEENKCRFKPKLLRISSQMVSTLCDEKSLGLTCDNIHEYTIIKNRRLIITNFNGTMLLMYHGLTIDKDTGLPAVPTEPVLQAVIEKYVIKRIMEEWWYNNSVPDMERKLAYASGQYDEAMTDARSFLKTPSFNTLVQLSYRRRSSLDKYQLNTKQYW
jgi:hypothetical protein